MECVCQSWSFRICGERSLQKLISELLSSWLQILIQSEFTSMTQLVHRFSDLINLNLIFLLCNPLLKVM